MKPIYCLNSPFAQILTNNNYTFPSVPTKYTENNWVDRGDCWEYITPQHDENGIANLDWLAVKTGRVSGTGVSYVMGHGFENKKTLADCALEFCGIKKKVFTETQLINMQHGTDNEENARIKYEERNNVQVIESGFMVPKYNNFIGISLDGSVVQPDINGLYGNIEIKCPKSMYGPLITYMQSENPDPNDYSHIWKSHFDQMQWGMGITRRHWTDYVVLDTYNSLYFQQRVWFNQEYFNLMYYKTMEFLNMYMFPLLQHSCYPLMPPR